MEILNLEIFTKTSFVLIVVLLYIKDNEAVKQKSIDQRSLLRRQQVESLFDNQSMLRVFVFG